METVKGFKDCSGEEAIKRQRIKEILVKNFELYGFEPAETPIVEFEEFVKGENVNDEAVSEIFKLQDRGKRKLALRYEFTFQLKRLASNKKLPYKIYQIGAVFRDEPVSANRFRQFTQCDVDVIGSSLKEDAAMLALTSKVLRELGIKAEINVNNRKLLNEILEKEGVVKKEEVIRELDKLDKMPEKIVKENLKKYKAEKIINIFKKTDSFFEQYDAYDEIKELKKYCNYYGVKFNFQSNLARGLSYYNGTIFEVKTKDVKETVCAGGSYLVNGVQSVGISFGLERLSALANVEIKGNKILLISIGQDEETMKLSEELRNEDIPCLIAFGQISRALGYANSINADYVIFVGEKEVKKGKFKLKDMDSGKEDMLKIKEIIKKLK
ncbi:MAG: histidine--tRNA ligase [Nanoarchaeota archaeon]|nr:histidine--tRNA ligase [Nanoarchaeota archaeon]